MQRNRFIRMIGAVGVAMASSATLLANTVKNFRDGEGFLVKSGKDRFDKQLNLFEGDTFSTKVGGKDTDGDIFVFESSRMKEGGPAFHYHFEQDEWWYVLKGEFLIKVGETTHHAKTGDSVFGPRMVPHSFSKIGEGEGKLLMFFQPAGKMEAFFIQIAAGATKGMTETQQDEFRKAHGFKRVGPPINISKKLS